MGRFLLDKMEIGSRFFVSLEEIQMGVWDCHFPNSPAHFNTDFVEMVLQEFSIENSLLGRGTIESLVTNALSFVIRYPRLK